MPGGTKVSVDQLQRLVRMYPSATAAGRAIGVSGTALRNILERNEIPFPEKWAQNKRGYKTEREIPQGE